MPKPFVSSKPEPHQLKLLSPSDYPEEFAKYHKPQDPCDDYPDPHYIWSLRKHPGSHCTTRRPSLAANPTATSSVSKSNHPSPTSLPETTPGRDSKPPSQARPENVAESHGIKDSDIPKFLDFLKKSRVFDLLQVPSNPLIGNGNSAAYWVKKRWIIPPKEIWRAPNKPKPTVGPSPMAEQVVESNIPKPNVSGRSLNLPGISFRRSLFDAVLLTKDFPDLMGDGTNHTSHFVGI